MSGPEPLSYNLIDEPWLPVRTMRGTVEDLSLLDVFRRAHEVSALVGDIPTQVFATTRLLLAILHRAVDGPSSVDHWEELWETPELPAGEVERYLRGHRARFDLFDPAKPFLQVAGLRTEKGEVSDLSKLIADVPNGRPFFTTRLGGPLSLSFAEAARWLVHCHAFDPSGIKSGAVDDPRAKNGKGYPIGVAWSGLLGGVLPEGRTLRDTLLLNLAPRSTTAMARTHERDLPAWERDAVGPNEEEPGGRAPTGPVDLYTWQSRRVRLFPRAGRVTGVLICNGEPLTPQDKFRIEPHTAWRRSTAQEKKLRRALVYMPREHDPERVVWRGLQSLLPGAEKPQSQDAAAFITPAVLEWLAEIEDVIGADYPVRLHTSGMAYGGQSATTTEVVDDALSLHAVLLSRDAERLAHTAVACVASAERAAQALGKLARNLAAAAGCGRDEREGPRARATESAYAGLDTRFRVWLTSLRRDTDPYAAERVWHRTADRTVRVLAGEMVAAAPMTAWTGRMVDKRMVNIPVAQAWFSADLRAALPLAFAEENEAAS
ncbi:type I-E CRISPR-associated protein Cse1/CasA [Actinosynnema sp. CA-248983]